MKNISIHSLRMEGDYRYYALEVIFYISIHSLRMEGDLVIRVFRIYKIFISIHSLRMEGDLVAGVIAVRVHQNFNPLPPHGGRPDNWDADQMEMFISIHSLRMEGDMTSATKRKRL